MKQTQQGQEQLKQTQQGQTHNSPQMWRDSEVTCSRNSLLPDDITEDLGKEELVDRMTGYHLSEEANSRGLYQEPLLCTHHLNKTESSWVTPQTSVSMLELCRQQQQALPFNTHVKEQLFPKAQQQQSLPFNTHMMKCCFTSTETVGLLGTGHT